LLEFDEEDAILKVKAVFWKKATEIILGAFLLVAIAVFSYGLKSQAELEDRVWDCEQTTIAHEAQIESIESQCALRERHIEVEIQAIRTALTERCNNMDAMLNLILETVSANKLEEDVTNGLSSMYD